MSKCKSLTISNSYTGSPPRNLENRPSPKGSRPFTFAPAFIIINIPMQLGIDFSNSPDPLSHAPHQTFLATSSSLLSLESTSSGYSIVDKDSRREKVSCHPRHFSRAAGRQREAISYALSVQPTNLGLIFIHSPDVQSRNDSYPFVRIYFHRTGGGNSLICRFSPSPSCVQRRQFLRGAFDFIAAHVSLRALILRRRERGLTRPPIILV